MNKGGKGAKRGSDQKRTEENRKRKESKGTENTVQKERDAAKATQAMSKGKHDDDDSWLSGTKSAEFKMHTLHVSFEAQQRARASGIALTARPLSDPSGFLATRYSEGDGRWTLHATAVLHTQLVYQQRSSRSRCQRVCSLNRNFVAHVEKDFFRKRIVELRAKSLTHGSPNASERCPLSS